MRWTLDLYHHVVTTRKEDKLIVFLLSLPNELLFEIFKYLPRDYIPDTFFYHSHYFRQLWLPLHIRAEITCYYDKRWGAPAVRRISEDGVKTRERSWLTTVDTPGNTADLVTEPTTVNSSFPRSIRSSDCHYKQGKRHGVCKTYDSEGKLSGWTPYHEGQKHGKSVVRFLGQICVINYRYGRKHGKSKLVSPFIFGDDNVIEGYYYYGLNVARKFVADLLKTSFIICQLSAIVIVARWFLSV